MVMTLFHGLICGVVALYTTRGLRSPCLMMAVRKRQNIVQWSYRRVPLNVVPRIPLLGYSDIDQRPADLTPKAFEVIRLPRRAPRADKDGGGNSKRCQNAITTRTQVKVHRNF